MLDNDLGNVQYNVLVHVTIAPWNEETIEEGDNAIRLVAGNSDRVYKRKSG